MAAIIVGASMALIVMQRHDSSQGSPAEQHAISTSPSHAYLASRPRVTATAKLSAPVTPCCNHPAGTWRRG
jgi:hypothetical protein